MATSILNATTQQIKQLYTKVVLLDATRTQKSAFLIQY